MPSQTFTRQIQNEYAKNAKQKLYNNFYIFSFLKKYIENHLWYLGRILTEFTNEQLPTFYIS